MTIRWIVASLHLLALGIGLGAVFVRARALRGSLDRPGLSRLFMADNLWGVAAVLWLATGIARAFGGLEKGTLYYVHNGLFHAKLGLFVLIFLLELWPMISLIRWRLAIRRGGAPDTRRARLFAVFSDVQTAIVLVIVFLATALARGLGV